MIGIWAGMAVVAGVAVGRPAIVAAILVGAILWYARQWSGALWIAVTILAIGGALRHHREPEPRDTYPPGAIVELRGTVVSRAVVRGTSQSFVVQAHQARDGGTWQPADLRLYVTADLTPAVGRDDDVYVVGSFESNTDIEPGFAAYLSSLGMDGSGFAQHLEIDDVGDGWRRTLDDVAVTIGRRLQSAVPGDRGILLAGFVTGDDAALSRDRARHFVSTGTTHLTAVSGANLALLLLLAGWVGNRSGLRRKIGWQLATIVLLASYAVLVGLEPPVVRATIVAAFALFASRVGRRPDFVTLIVLAAAVQAIAQPGNLGRLAFQLSFASSLALVVALVGGPASGIVGWAWRTVVCVCAAQIATVAILAMEFGTISLVSLPANLLIAPIAALSFVGAAIASVVFPVSASLGTAIAVVAGLGARYIIAVVDFFGSSSGGTLSVGPMSWFTRLILMAASAGGVVAMSAEVRQAIGRWWRTARQNHVQTVVAAVGVLAGIVLGVTAAAWL